MMRSLCRLMPAKRVLGSMLVLCGVLCATGDACAQTKASGDDGAPTAAQGQKRAAAQAGKSKRQDAKTAPKSGQVPGGAVRASEPSAAYRESLRLTVERRRQRRARRQQGAADAGVSGAIVPWPMPPVLIIRHTREVHGEIESLSGGLRR